MPESSTTSVPQPTRPQPAPTTVEGSKATPVASTAGVGRGELLELLREARMAIGPEYVDLLGRISDAIHGPDCVFCGRMGHFSMDCRAYAPTGKQP